MVRIVRWLGSVGKLVVWILHHRKRKTVLLVQNLRRKQRTDRELFKRQLDPRDPLAGPLEVRIGGIFGGIYQVGGIERKA